MPATVVAAIRWPAASARRAATASPIRSAGQGITSAPGKGVPGPRWTSARCREPNRPVVGARQRSAKRGAMAATSVATMRTRSARLRISASVVVTVPPSCMARTLAKQAARAGMVDDAAQAVGQGQDRADAGDVGAEPAEQRQGTGLEQLGGAGDGGVERGGSAVDQGCRGRRRAGEALGRDGAVGPCQPQCPALGRHLEIVAAQGAERAHHVPEHDRSLVHHALPPVLSREPSRAGWPGQSGGPAQALGASYLT